MIALATLLVFALLGLAAPISARAHGGVTMENDMCKLRAGPYLMHFTGYQPLTAPELEFCEDIAGTGQTLIVLDYLDQKLRDLPVEVRIIRDTGDESDLQRVTVLHMLPALYPRGSVVIDHHFSEPGNFVGLVTVGDQISRFPFAVGTGGRRAVVLYAVFAAIALGAGALLFLYSTQRA
ncbi:MAG: hypothetical protein ACREQQ_11160 [Candidatus Binatia bacterium]